MSENITIQSSMQGGREGTVSVKLHGAAILEVRFHILYVISRGENNRQLSMTHKVKPGWLGCLIVSLEWSWRSDNPEYQDRAELGRSISPPAHFFCCSKRLLDSSSMRLALKAFALPRSSFRASIFSSIMSSNCWQYAAKNG